MSSQSNILNDLDIVITRPKVQGEKWQQQLTALGACSYLMPVLEIHSLKSADLFNDNPQEQSRRLNKIKSIILQLDEFQKIIFVSQNAVLEAAGWIDDFWPQRPVGIEYFAVGSATAKLAAQRDFEIIAPEEAMNSEDLLALEAMGNVKDHKVLIFRGVGGRTYLSEELTKRGASVTYGELYTRELPLKAFTQIHELKLGNNSRKTVLSAHSGESVVNLNAVLETLSESDMAVDRDKSASIKKLPLLIPGDRVAKIADDLGFKKLIIAKNATDNEMTQALCDWEKTT
ncbi:MAG: uroporphyrinogen-III synthase [Cellvibrionaceae bacterium]